MLLRMLCLLLLPGAASMAQAADFQTRVVVILDGDTVMAVRTCEQPGCRESPALRIRLADIDAPEMGQPGGTASKATLSTLLLHKTVRVTPLGIDKFGRLVARLTFNDLDVNADQVRRGMAWEYSLHHRNRAYVLLQREAHQSRRGLWQQSHPLPPWRWRKLHAH